MPSNIYKLELKEIIKLPKARKRAEAAIENEEMLFDIIKDEDKTSLKALLLMDEKKVMKALIENTKGALSLFYFRNPNKFLTLAMRYHFADDLLDEIRMLLENLHEDASEEYSFKLKKAVLHALLEDLYRSAESLEKTDKKAFENAIEQSLDESEGNELASAFYSSTISI